MRPTPLNTEAAGELTTRLNAAIAAIWEAESVRPAPVSDDAAYFRRLNLDLVGRIPTAAEAQAFIDSAAPDKRRGAVAELLGRPTHVVHFTNFWRGVLLPEAAADVSVRGFVPGFEDWLRQRLLAGQRYDDLVREVLTTPRITMELTPGEATPAAFFDAKGDTPEALAAASSRAFLGVRMECAQCHDHPFDPWTQEQFWQLAAFFKLSAPGRAPSIEIMEGGGRVSATFPDGTVPEFSTRDPRAELAEWIVSPENPYFAKAIANRLWAHFFGAGLVEPVDDFSPSNPSVRPELLEIVAEALIESGYDMSAVMAGIVGTDAYQLSSLRTDASQDDETAFARTPVRAMTPEQLYDSLCQATGRFIVFDPSQPVNFSRDADRSAFLEQFAREPSAATRQPSSILQSLMLMNGSFIGSATDLEDSRTLSAIAAAPFLDTGERVETLYLATLSRRPSEGELRRSQMYLAGSGDEAAGLADLFWTLLNSPEFLFNH